MLLIVFYTALLPSCKRTNFFDGQRAFVYIEKQLSFGYRIPGSQASIDTSIFIRDILEENGWTVSFQEFDYDGVSIRNIIATQNDSSSNVILGTHYDTRLISDQELTEGTQLIPVPGANDGASGTAILLELSHHIKEVDKSIWLVFFDAEDQGGIDGWQWSIGAEYFATNITSLPDSVVIVDMVGDKDLEIFKEKNSDPGLTEEIWAAAKNLGYGNIFLNLPKYAMIDDHMPFINRGVPSALLIDFDYPYWHTNEDTLDKVSSNSLKIVGEVLLSWIINSD